MAADHITHLHQARGANITLYMQLLLMQNTQHYLLEVTHLYNDAAISFHLLEIILKD